jgi:hypothetical protein
MQSWAENLGGGRTEPRGDETAPDGGEPVTADDQAASADGEPVTADDQAAAAGDHPVAADHQAVAADDQPVSAGGEPVASDDQAAAAGDQPVPAHDLVMIVTEDDQDATATADDEGDTAGRESGPGLAAFVPARVAAAGGSRPAFAGSSADAAAGEAGIGAGPAPDASQPVADEATPDSTASLSPEPGPAQGADSVSAAGRWTEIQAMFVDDPRASVELAADLVDDSLEAFIASARQLQGSLRSTWGGADADTEQLRKALQRYRTFWRHLHSISIEP